MGRVLAVCGLMARGRRVFEAPTPVVPTLEEMAQVIQRQRGRVEEAVSTRERLRPAFEAAAAAVAQAQRELGALERALASAKTSHAVARAIVELGVDYAGPHAIAAKVYEGHEYYLLVAVGPMGTGLYLHAPDRSRRHMRKEYAVRRDQAVARGFDEAATQPYWRGRTSRSQSDAGLVAWEGMGAGSLGAHSGPRKALAPPEGGRWRWLKVREQESLTAAS